MSLDLWMNWFSSRYRHPQAMSLAICSRSRMVREKVWPWKRHSSDQPGPNVQIKTMQSCCTARGLFCLRKLFMSPPVISSSRMKRGRMFRLTPTQRTMFRWLNLLWGQKVEKKKAFGWEEVSASRSFIKDYLNDFAQFLKSKHEMDVKYTFSNVKKN